MRRKERRNFLKCSIFKARRSIACLMVGITLVSFSVSAQAYSTCGYKLKGSWWNKKYYVTSQSVNYGGKTVHYGNITSSAVGAWNNAVNSSAGHSLNISLQQTTQGLSVNTPVVVLPQNRGDTNWNGFTYYYDYDGMTDQWNVINPGNYPNQDYQAGFAVINIYNVQSNPSWKIQNTIMHEMGHIFGLKHSSISGVLLYKFSDGYTSLKLPQSDDVNGVRHIYE